MPDTGRTWKESHATTDLCACFNGSGFLHQLSKTGRNRTGCNTCIDWSSAGPMHRLWRCGGCKDGYEHRSPSCKKAGTWRNRRRRSEQTGNIQACHALRNTDPDAQRQKSSRHTNGSVLGAAYWQQSQSQPGPDSCSCTLIL
jgi:hypothetical protein